MLDLYAGTGAMGIEALSRGAEHVVFVEDDHVSRATIGENLRLCSLTSRATLVPFDVSRYLRQRHLHESTSHFDMIVVDPPYHDTDYQELLESLSQFPKMSSASMVIIEHFSKTVLPDQVDRLIQYRQSRYGDTTLTFFQIL